MGGSDRGWVEERVSQYDLAKMSETVTSTQNPLVKRIRRLRQKKYRLKEGAFFIEGLRVVLSALEQRASIETLVFCHELLSSEIGRRAVERQQEQGAHCVELSSPVFETISGRQNPIGLGAIISISWADLAAISPAKEDVLVALVDVSDPGNLGTIIRTVDAAGGAGLIQVGQSVDPFHPTAVKASMGSIFSVPIGRLRTTDELFKWAASRKLFTLATSAGSNNSFWSATYRYPLLLILGSEGGGLSRSVLEDSSQNVAIPMAGSATSLNLAVAAGLLLYEVRRPFFNNLATKPSLQDNP